MGDLSDSFIAGPSASTSASLSAGVAPESGPQHTRMAGVEFGAGSGAAKDGALRTGAESVQSSSSVYEETSVEVKSAVEATLRTPDLVISLTPFKTAANGTCPQIRKLSPRTPGSEPGTVDAEVSPAPQQRAPGPPGDIARRKSTDSSFSAVDPFAAVGGDDSTSASSSTASSAPMETQGAVLAEAISSGSSSSSDSSHEESAAGLGTHEQSMMEDVVIPEPLSAVPGVAATTAPQETSTPPQQQQGNAIRGSPRPGPVAVTVTGAAGEKRKSLRIRVKTDKARQHSSASRVSPSRARRGSASSGTSASKQAQKKAMSPLVSAASPRHGSRHPSPRHTPARGGSVGRASPRNSPHTPTFLGSPRTLGRVAAPSVNNIVLTGTAPSRFNAAYWEQRTAIATPTVTEIHPKLLLQRAATERALKVAPEDTLDETYFYRHKRAYEEEKRHTAEVLERLNKKKHPHRKKSLSSSCDGDSPSDANAEAAAAATAAVESGSVVTGLALDGQFNYECSPNRGKKRRRPRGFQLPETLIRCVADRARFSLSATPRGPVAASLSEDLLEQKKQALSGMEQRTPRAPKRACSSSKKARQKKSNRHTTRTAPFSAPPAPVPRVAVSSQVQNYALLKLRHLQLQKKLSMLSKSKAQSARQGSAP